MFGPVAVPEPARVPRRVVAGLAALAGHAALIAAAVYATAAATPPGDTPLEVGPIVYVSPDSPDPAPDVASSLALPAAPWIQPLLFRQPARDPQTYALVALLLVCVALVASAFPALRATRADPNTALRAE